MLQQLRAAVRLAVVANPLPTDPFRARQALYTTARDIERLVTRVVFEGRTTAREQSRRALRAELALAQRYGVTPPALEPLADAETTDQQAAARVGRSYADSWLSKALAAHDAEALAASRQSDRVGAGAHRGQRDGERLQR